MFLDISHSRPHPTPADQNAYQQRLPRRPDLEMVDLSNGLAERACGVGYERLRHRVKFLQGALALAPGTAELTFAWRGEIVRDKLRNSHEGVELPSKCGPRSFATLFAVRPWRPAQHANRLLASDTRAEEQHIQTTLEGLCPEPFSCLGGSLISDTDACFNATSASYDRVAADNTHATNSRCVSRARHVHRCIARPPRCDTALAVQCQLRGGWSISGDDHIYAIPKSDCQRPPFG